MQTKWFQQEASDSSCPTTVSGNSEKEQLCAGAKHKQEPGEAEQWSPVGTVMEKIWLYFYWGFFILRPCPAAAQTHASAEAFRSLEIQCWKLKCFWIKCLFFCTALFNIKMHFSCRFSSNFYYLGMRSHLLLNPDIYIVYKKSGDLLSFHCLTLI